MSNNRKERFVWRDGDVVDVAGAKEDDPKKMSESEKAFFLKQQKSK